MSWTVYGHECDNSIRTWMWQLNDNVYLTCFFTRNITTYKYRLSSSFHTQLQYYRHTHLHIILAQIIHNSQTILSKQCLITILQITTQFTTPHPKIFSRFSHTTMNHKTINHKICFPSSNMTIHHRTLHRSFFSHR